MTTAERVAPRRLIVGGLASVIENAVALLKALALPLTLYVAVSLVPMTIDPESPPVLSLALMTIASLLLHTWLAITTHRIVLLGADAVPEWGLKRWSGRETRFVLMLLGLFGGGLLVGLMLAVIPVLGPMIFLAVAMVGGSCLSLVFPAIAIDEATSFGAAWAMARPHIMTLVVCVCLFPFVLAIPVILLGALPYTGPLVALLQALTTVLTISILSVAYMEIRRAG